MLPDVGLTLAALRRLIAPALATGQAFDAIESAGRGLPAAFSGGYLECPFDAAGARVDLLLSTRLERTGGLALAGEQEWPRHLMEDAGWRGVACFHEQWRSSFAGRVPLTSVELDLDGSSKGPGFHLCLAPDFDVLAANQFITCNSEPPAEQLIQLVADTAMILRGQVVDPARLGTLLRCRSALPHGGRLLHLSFMPARPGAPWKLNVVVPREKLESFLKAAGWTGDGDAVTRLLARYGAGLEVVKLDLTLLGDHLSSSIGVEFAFPGTPALEPRWQSLLDRLVIDGLSTDEQARGVAAWFVAGEIRADDRSWPLAFANSAVLKLVVDGQAVRAKAYLGFEVDLGPLVGGELDLSRPAVKRPAPIASLSGFLEGHLAFPPDLVNDEAFGRLQAAARKLPDISGEWCFECRLAADESSVDVLACVNADLNGRDSLAAGAPLRWATAERVFRSWRDPQSVLNRRVQFLWFELDLPEHGAMTDEACLYLGIRARHDVVASGPFAANVWRPADLSSFAAALSDIIGHPDREGIARAVTVCFEALPVGGQLNCLGVMVGRPGTGLRLSLELPPATLDAFLTAIEWPGTERALRVVRPHIKAGVDRLALSIDVAETVQPQLGFELYFHNSPAEEPRFAALFEQLVEDGHCTAAKARAVKTWRGRFADGRGNVLARAVHHVKLVVNGAAPIRAKSYLWLTADRSADGGREAIHAAAE